MDVNLMTCMCLSWPPAGIQGLVEGAVSLLSRSPASATAFSMGDLLFTLAIKVGKPALMIASPS
jgi:hypothetical protein